MTIWVNRSNSNRKEDRMFIYLEKEKQQYLRENIESVISDAETFAKSVNIVNKNSSDKVYLEGLIQTAKEKKEIIVPLLPNVKQKLKEKNFEVSLFFFDDFEKRVKELVETLDAIINGCNERIQNHLPLDEKISICELIRISFPGEYLVKANICELSGCKNYDDFFTMTKFKISPIVLLKYGIRKKDLIVFLKDAQDVLNGYSSNVEFTEMQRDFRYCLAGCTTKTLQENLVELAREYEKIKDKRNIANDLSCYENEQRLKREKGLIK